MRHEPVQPPRPDRRLAGAADFARAKASHAAGAGVADLIVRQWLLAWGAPGRKPCPDWLKDQDG